MNRFIINVEFEFDVDDDEDPGDVIHAIISHASENDRLAAYHLDTGSLRREGEPRK